MVVGTRQEVHLHVIQVKGTDPYREPSLSCLSKQFDCSRSIHRSVLSRSFCSFGDELLSSQDLCHHLMFKTPRWGDRSEELHLWAPASMLLSQHITLACGPSFILPLSSSILHPCFLFILIPFGLHINGLLCSQTMTNPTHFPIPTFSQYMSLPLYICNFNLCLLFHRT